MKPSAFAFSTSISSCYLIITSAFHLPWSEPAVELLAPSIVADCFVVAIAACSVNSITIF